MFGVTHSLYGLGVADRYVRRRLEKAKREGRITLEKELEALWILTDFKDEIMRRVIENLEKCMGGGRPKKGVRHEASHPLK